MVAPPNATTIKFLCSYGGKILPRYPDGKLRYHGGQTRVLAVDRHISFAELLVKLGELCGTLVNLKCQLPTEDLDALVSITSDEDLANLIEEYDRASASKIRAFLYPPKSAKTISPPPSIASASTNGVSQKSSFSFASSSSSRFPLPPPGRCIHQISKPVVYPLCYEKSAAGKVSYDAYHSRHGKPSHVYLVHNGNHWQ
ncbi:octicosapeptide/Phox/Bem1p (PB1) domain-containing protein [Actinidia rufa]|uniref:Octicosapeptide/Phox/Bem1p (PB1) domain-containing protein n=1 Tax=Actinidia rufa TaxID=165716 RepID=A0A7J0EYD0_9ERIC|nr:octicosapeptide/Phox/Bem1p (PB1) domain-containing protein [Actinidia rufa]